MELTKQQIKLIKMKLMAINTDEQYREMMNEVHGDVDIAGYTYPCAMALERIDPTAYRVGQADFESTNEEWTEIDGDYYWTFEVESLLEDLE